MNNRTLGPPKGTIILETRSSRVAAGKQIWRFDFVAEVIWILSMRSKAQTDVSAANGEGSNFGLSDY